MDKLKNIVEQVGRRKPIEESLPKVNGVHLRKNMVVRLKPEKEMSANHYYENHPQKYKKMIAQIAGTEQTIEKIGGTKSSFDINNVKLVGFDDWIYEEDIEQIVDFQGVIHLDSNDMVDLKWRIYHSVIDFLKSDTDIDVKTISYKEVGKIIRDAANQIGKEGKPEKTVHS